MLGKIPTQRRISNYNQKTLRKYTSKRSNVIFKLPKSPQKMILLNPTNSNESIPYMNPKPKIPKYHITDKFCSRPVFYLPAFILQHTSLSIIFLSGGGPKSPHACTISH